MLKRGRPPNGDVAATERLEVRVTPERMGLYQAAADKSGVSRSAWVLAALDAAAGKRPARLDLRTIKSELARVSAMVDEL